MKCFVCEQGDDPGYLCEACKREEAEFYKHFEEEMRKLYPDIYKDGNHELRKIR